MSTELQIGSFYWVRLVIGDERQNVIPETSWQPARYTGRSADTHAREETRGNEIVVVAYSPETWDFIGYASADGHHHVDVMQVGAKIVQHPPETDSDFRERLQDVDRLSEDHVNLAATATGKDLDTLAGFYDLTRRL